MKKLNILIASLVLMVGCAKDNIDFYGETEYIFFANTSTNVIEYSFAFNPGADQDTIPLVIRLIGLPTSIDRTVSIVVDPDNTSALDSDYDLPTRAVLRAGRVADTIPLVLHNSERLALEKFTLRIAIVENENFLEGPETNRYVDVLFSDIIARPIWWNNIVTTNFLGAYSDAKYRLFIEATGIADMGDLSENEQRAYAIIFRDFLAAGREKGEVYNDENGIINVSPNLT